MSETALLNELMDPLTECLDSESAQRLVDFGLAPAVQERMSALAEKANEGSLTEDERNGYEALISATDFIAILKLKAQRRLSTSTHP